MRSRLFTLQLILIEMYKNKCQRLSGWGWELFSLKKKEKKFGTTELMLEIVTSGCLHTWESFRKMKHRFRSVSPQAAFTATTVLPWTHLFWKGRPVVQPWQFLKHPGMTFASDLSDSTFQSASRLLPTQHVTNKIVTAITLEVKAV